MVVSRSSTLVIVLGLLALGPALLLPAHVSAGGPTDELRGLFTGANRILADADQRDLEETLLAIIALARPMLATREAAEVALGPEWRGRTPAEREEFVRLFGDLLERALVLRLAGAARGGTGVEMRFLEETIEGERATVQATVVGKDGHEIPLEYRLIRRNRGWAVRDVAIDGVSVVANFQAQFARIIRDASYPELVARLREKASTGMGATVLAARPAARPSVVADARTSTGPTATDVVVEPSLPQPLALAARSSDGDLFERRSPPSPRPPTVAPAVRAPEPVAVLSTPPPSTPRLVVAESVSPRYWVQVGAFKDVDTATRLAERLLASHLPVAIAPGAPLTRVRVGPFPDRAQATSQLRALTVLGYRPFLAEERAERGSAARP